MIRRLAYGYLSVLILAAIFAPAVTHVSYEVQNVNHVLEKPSLHFIFGTDFLGRDLFSRTIYGARVSLLMATMTSLAGLGLALVFGFVMLWLPKPFEKLVDSFLDFYQSIPPIVILVLLAGFSRHGPGTASLVVALVFVSWPYAARVMSAKMRALNSEPFIQASRAMGGKKFWIFRQMAPHLKPSIMVVLGYLIPSQILLESFFSFLGLGLQPPLSSWGVLAWEGWQNFRGYPHLLLGPGIVFVITMMALQFTVGHTSLRRDIQLT